MGRGRREHLTGSSIWDTDKPQGDFTTIQADAAIFGQIASIDASKQVANPVKIMEIYPDHTQPRRAVPSAVRAHWDGQPQSITQVFAAWLEHINEERARIQPQAAPFDPAPFLYLQETEDRLDPCGPLEAAFLKLIELAASIRRDGLTNPITVVRQGPHFRLETGERRWLAYHLLYAWFDGHDGRPNERAQWSKIPARQVEKLDVWRQASENNARHNLNAIGRARQFAVLLMDLHGMDNFKPFDAFEIEQDYYAQVADGDVWRIPRGKAELLLTGVGLKHVDQLRQIRRLLRLPNDLWVHADDHNLSENELRKVALDDYTVTKITVSPENDPPPAWERPFNRLERELIPRRWRRKSSEERRRIYQRTKAMLDKMEALGFGE